jgi:Icc-related predicted phosphoesterase
MPGIKGMKMTPKPNATRRQVWKSMRILKRFTIPDLMRTLTVEVTYENVQKYVRKLMRHGYIKKTGRYTGGRVGEYQIYQLVRDTGPDYPVVCTKCKQPISFTHCAPKETEKENGKAEQGQPVSAIQEARHDAP